MSKIKEIVESDNDNREILYRERYAEKVIDVKHNGFNRNRRVGAFVGGMPFLERDVQPVEDAFVEGLEE